MTSDKTARPALDAAREWLRRAAESTDIRHSRQPTGAEDLAALLEARERESYERGVLDTLKSFAAPEQVKPTKGGTK